MHHVGLSLRSLHQVGVPGALQFDIRAVARSQNIYVRVQFVRSRQFARARHGDGMTPSRAALGGQQVVIAVPLVEMGTLGKSKRRALEDQVNRPHQLALRGRVLLQHDTRKSIASRPMVPAHIDQVFPAVVVVEQRRIEAAAVEVNRIRPLAVDPRAGHQIVVCVTQRRAGCRLPESCGRIVSRPYRSARRGRRRS